MSVYNSQPSSLKTLTHQSNEKKQQTTTTNQEVVVSKKAFTLFLSALFLVIIFLLAAIIYKLYVGKRDFLLNEANKRSLRSQVLQHPRGVIYDRNGVVLAKAISSPTLAIDNQNFIEANKTATSKGNLELAQVLGLAPEILWETIGQNPKSRYRILARNLQPNQVDYLNSNRIKGVFLEQGFKRFYPYGEVVAQLIGITNAEQQGVEGVELSFNKILQSTPAKNIIEVDKYGNIISLDQLTSGNPGNNIYLSIDIQVQQLLFNRLSQAVAEHKADRGSAMIVDSQTGEIIAMANANSYNPNNFTREEILKYGRNSAIVDVFEPGSTVKPFSMIEALTSKVTHPREIIDTRSLVVNGFRIHDVAPRNQLSLAQIIAKSSNIGIATLALRMPQKALYEKFKILGFGSRLGLGLIGEQKGLYPAENRYWSQIDQAAFAYGYGYAITIAQLVQAYTILANYGKKIPLTIFKRNNDVQGEQVLDPDITKLVVHMMEGVAHPANNSRAHIPNYSVAIKTGTAKKIEHGKYIDKYIAYTAGFAPSRDPRYVLVVMVDNPTAGSYYGGAVSAPVFRDVMAELLVMKNIAEDNSDANRRIYKIEDFLDVKIQDIDDLIKALEQQSHSDNLNHYPNSFNQ